MSRDPSTSTPEVRCLACGHVGLEPVLSLGRTPLANALLCQADLDRPEPTYPLDVAFCTACSLVQLTMSVPPEQMFREYSYLSSVSDALVAHARTLVERLIADRSLGPDDLVVEVASNDGYLLQHYAAAGVPVLGIEPARNIADVARDRGIETVDEFFGLDLARGLRAAGRQASVIHANNVLAHVPDLTGLVAGIRELLRPDGIASIEVPYLVDLVDGCEFDTIYHEHLCYFSLTAVDRLFGGQGLTVVDVERTPIHGGSLRIFAAPSEAAAGRSPRVGALIDEEAAWGVHDARTYARFAARVHDLTRDLVDLLARLRAAGSRVAAYGASAKGATLLNHAGIGRDQIEFVADRNPYKQGRYMPGARVPIVPASALLERAPDYALLLTWNFADEILAQQAEYRARGGRFIVPIPRLDIR
jgi:SAM-dependent methyltransferase